MNLDDSIYVTNREFCIKLFQKLITRTIRQYLIHSQLFENDEFDLVVIFFNCNQ